MTVAFVCPDCRRQLSAWACAEHGRFPVVDGVPAFAEDEGAEFDLHWRTAGRQAPSKRAAAAAFLQPLLARTTAEDVLLDAGCGDGVHVGLLVEEGRSGAAVDLSTAALGRMRSGAQGWTLAQASMLELPFADETFAAGFSYGVVAYTGDPARAVAELVRVVRRGGLVGVWVAPARRGIGGLALRAARAVATRSHVAAVALAGLIVPFLAVLPKASGVTWRNSGFRAALEVVLVNIEPAELVFPEYEDVVGWLAAAGAEVVVDDGEPITVWAVRR